MRLRRPCGYRLVRTCITRPTDTHYVVGVKLLCKLGIEASCANLIVEKRFNSPVTRKKYRHARFQVAIIHRSADVVFVDDHRDEELGRLQASYAENLCDTEVEGKEISVT